MFALHLQGIGGTEISRRCAEGLASVAPFKIPARTVRSIVQLMSREQGAMPPRELEEIANGDHSPRAELALLERERGRLEKKANNGRPLSRSDIEGLALIGTKKMELSTERANCG